MTIESSIGNALFTKTQQRVLGFLYGKVDRSYYLNELVRFADMGKGTVGRELEKLVSAGIIVSRKQGNQTHYQANPECPVFSELKSIIQKTVGLVDVLLPALEPYVASLDLAFVYGSMAKGGEHSGSDIDLMLVGRDLDYSEIIGALIPVAEQLSREINPTILSAEEFQQRVDKKQSFTTRILEQDKIWLLGENRLGRYITG